MTVTALVTRNDITATASQTSFTYTFRVLAATDMDVYQNGVLLSSGYTVNDVGNTTGGTVTLDSGVPVGQIVSLVLAMPLDRTTNYQNSGKFLADDVNEDFDKIYIGAVQNENEGGRSLRLKDVEPPTSGVDMTIPLKDDRKGKFLKFDSVTGGPIASSLSEEYDSTAWSVYDFTGNGSTTAFTLGSDPASENNTQVYIDGVYQQKDGYSVSGTVLTFSVAPPNLSTIEVMVATVKAVGSTSSDLVSYTPAGTGAVATTVQTKLRETVSVKDFGAVGDGVTDNTAAIQAAIDSGASYVTIPEGNFLISSQIDLASNCAIKCIGNIVVSASISPVSALFSATSKTNIKWNGGTIDATNNASFASNFFYFNACTKIKINNLQIIDSGFDRYPNGGIRTINGSKFTLSNIQMYDIGGLGLQTTGDTHSSFSNMQIEQTTTRSAIETNNGNHNTYTNCIIEASSTTASALSFNDKHSVCSNNSVTGGGYGITVGHPAPYEADYSVVTGNSIDSPALIGLNIQASTGISVSNNVVYNAPIGLQASSGAEVGSVSGNVIKDASSIGMRLGNYYAASGNVIDGFGSTGLRCHTDTGHVVLTGNVALNSTSGTGVAYDWGAVATQINAVAVGNFAGDNKGIATLNTGFRANNNQNLFLGNATDGNATFRQFDGPYSSSTQKDLSSTTLEDGIFYKQINGGTGSAGAGTQYIALTMNNGLTYKVLHDGTV